MSRTVRAELLLPHEMTAALTGRSVVYLPLGSVEFHSAHLPIGLDGLTAHGVCVRAAQGAGGVVLPPLYYGVGGGHTAYPWTIMADSPAPIRGLLEQSLRRLHEFGVRTVVLFTGHFADEQLELIDEVAADWNGVGSKMRVLALSVNRAPARIAPDHAGVFETSLLSALHPDRVQLAQLGLAPANEPDRHDPGHPLYGVFGPDPRTFDPATAGDLLAEIVAWVISNVESEDQP